MLGFSGQVYDILSICGCQPPHYQALHEADVVVLGEDLRQHAQLLATLSPGQAALAMTWYNACVAEGCLVDPAPGDVLHGVAWLLAGQHMWQARHQLMTRSAAKSAHQAGMLQPHISTLSGQPVARSGQVFGGRQQLPQHSGPQLLTPSCSAPAPKRLSCSSMGSGLTAASPESPSHGPDRSQSVPTTQPLQLSSMMGQVRSAGSEGGSVNGGGGGAVSQPGEDDCNASQSTSTSSSSSTLVLSCSLLPGRYDLWAGRLSAGSDVELLMLQVRMCVCGSGAGLELPKARYVNHTAVAVLHPQWSMQATYDKARSESLGNERLVAAFKEIAKWVNAAGHMVDKCSRVPLEASSLSSALLGPQVRGGRGAQQPEAGQ
jgi:hypothetical protein